MTNKIQWGWRVRSKPSKFAGDRPWHWQADEPTGITAENCEYVPVFVDDPETYALEAPAEGAGERGAPLTFTPFRDELREAQAALEPFSFIAERRSLSPATTVHLVHLDGTHIETLEVNSFWRARHAHSALHARSSAPEAREGLLTDALELVKEVIADKLADKTKAEKRQQKAQLRNTLSEALARKQDEALSSQSVEDIKKQLAALDDDED